MTHTSTEQPEALRLAELLENKVRGGAHPNHWVFLREGATELRRLHARVQEMEASKAQRVPLSDEQLSKALEDGCVCTQTHIGITNRVSWTTYGSIDPRKICRAIEAAHGITQEKQG